jgi:hypothetical protein
MKRSAMILFKKSSNAHEALNAPLKNGSDETVKRLTLLKNKAMKRLANFFIVIVWFKNTAENHDENVLLSNVCDCNHDDSIC